MVGSKRCTAQKFAILSTEIEFAGEKLVERASQQQS